MAEHTPTVLKEQFIVMGEKLSLRTYLESSFISESLSFTC